MRKMKKNENGKDKEKGIFLSVSELFKSKKDESESAIEILSDIKNLITQYNLISLNLQTIDPTTLTKQFDITTAAQLIYRADQRCCIVLSRPGLTGEGSGNLFIGNSSSVNSTNGFGIAAGDSIKRFILERYAEVWAVSSGTNKLHLMVTLI